MNTEEKDDAANIAANDKSDITPGPDTRTVSEESKSTEETESNVSNKQDGTINDKQSTIENLKKILENFGKNSTDPKDDIDDILSNIINTKNIVIANEIHGSSFFGPDNSIPEGPENVPTLDLESMDKLEDFFQFYKRKNHMLYYYTLAMILLRAVEENKLDMLARDLSKYFEIDSDEMPEEYHYSFSRLKSQLGIQAMGLVKQTRNSTQQINGIGFEDNKVKKLRLILWNEYIQLRTPMMEWLLDLYKKSHDETILLWSRSAILDYVDIDAAYISEYVVPKIAKWTYNSNLEFLSVLMMKLYRKYDFQKQVSGTLNKWTTWHDRNLFLVSYICHAVDDGYGVLAGNLNEALQKIYITGADENRENVVSYQILFIMRLYEKSADTLFQNYREVYDEADTKEDKYRCCLNFLRLLIADIVLCRKKKNEPVIIKSLHDVARRRTLAPLLQELWKNADTRNLLALLLDLHFTVFQETHNNTVDILTPFLQMLAFSGSQVCYENVIVYLKRPNDGKSCTAKTHIAAFLEALLIQRKKERENSK